MPFLRHPGFVGRKDDLAKIHALFQRGPKAAVRPVSVAAMGGIGKTQMAVEYAYQHRDDYPGGIYWVNAAGDVMADIAGLAVKAGLPEDSASESERQWRRVQAGPSRSRPRCRSRGRRPPSSRVEGRQSPW